VAVCLINKVYVAIAAFTLLWHAKVPMHYRLIAERARQVRPEDDQVAAL
jgi:hypothetical protein